MLSFNINLSLYAPSLNRAYLASAYASVQIPLRGASDTLETLSAIADKEMIIWGEK